VSTTNGLSSNYQCINLFYCIFSVFLNNVSHSALKDLIQFMYCGEVNVKQDALPAFISTAESLQIKGLTDVSRKKKNIHTYIHKPNEREQRQAPFARNTYKQTHAHTHDICLYKSWPDCTVPEQQRSISNCTLLTNAQTCACNRDGTRLMAVG